MTGIYFANHSVAHSQFIFASQQSGTSRFTQPERPFIMFRKLLLSTALLASFSGLAMADGGDSNIEQFMASQPHAAGISNGTALIIDNQGGQPVIAYHGAASQGWGAGVATIVDNQDGQPVIRYEQSATGGSALAETVNGQSPVRVN
ncbi:hypothetical protein [Roseomonas marmotae]|uniref:Curlin n=1 Tax=Roseomonas marmotae TaxID=2768161 RepID=A0ABS3KI38_9PROT|nr:hypothetical protein [Roseomonas marmotae]MBO1077122.1 hypothetical protein [Roseomonas marmotae]QTI81162.1 hypothetical protein IAI58_17570 [Roseomonas marmotae]